MSFFTVLDNNVCIITGNGFIKVQGPIQVSSSQQSSSQQSLSQQFYSFSNSLESSAFEFENFNNSLSSGSAFEFTSENSFTVGSTDYTEVKINGNKIEFTSEIYIELPDDINSTTTIFTKTDGVKEYLLYKDVNNGLYDIVVIFNCTDDTVEVKQLYHEKQLGDDIDGAVSNDYSGTSVSLSSDGMIVAIGAHGHDSNKGHVRVYEYTNGGSWEQLGFDIDGESFTDFSGRSVSLSSDGKIVAIGAYYSDNDTGDNGIGHVRVYEYDPYKTTSVTDQTSPDFGPVGWRRLGYDIDGEVSNDYSGNSVSLSSDGMIVAIGAYGHDFFKGRVRVYKWRQYTQDDKDNSTYHYTSYTQNSTQTKPLIVTASTSTTPVVGDSYWTQLGLDIYGAESKDFSGISVSLSLDGKIVAIGEYGHDNNKGRVLVYEYNETSNTWPQLGSDIVGEANDNSGNSVSLSSDGMIVAIGALWHDNVKGCVRVYEYNETSNTWTQLGSDIDGELAGDQSGYSVSLSSDGTIVAIGAHLNDGTGASSGHTRIYKYNGENWIKIILDIDGEAANDRSGYSVSLSSDGTIVAIGAYLNDAGNSTDTKHGHVKVYQLIPTDTQTQTLGVKYRTGKDIVEVEVSPSQQVGGYNYLIDN